MIGLWKKLESAWVRFFFEPTNPATLGIYRIAFGLVVFLSNLGHFPSRDIFYGENAIVRYQSMDKIFPHVHPWLFFRWLPQTEPELKFYFVALLIINILFVLGLFSRLSTILLFVGIISLSNRNPYNENAGDTLIRLNLFFLLFTNVGAAYSLDRFFKFKMGLASPTHETISPWPLRLLQMQFVYVYIDTVYLKMVGPAWRDGTAMYYALNYLELRRFDFRFLFDNIWLIKLSSYSVILGETAIGFLIWFRKLRYWIIGMVFALHGGINLMMQFPVFQYVMMSSVLIFIYPEDCERVVASLIKKFYKIKSKRLILTHQKTNSF